ncbi:MAG: hypothetical protein AB3N21_05335 [Ruegeria sp.]|uniref:hypothetical protein n=1 Tax=Ruegeria sp. TaxID=1879320 RepID=UPI00349EEB99
MIDTNILDMLGDISRRATARLSPANTLSGTTASERRVEILRTIRGTILPRRLEFSSENEDRLVLEVSSSRVTDVLEATQGDAPGFDADDREQVTMRLAQLISKFSETIGPLEVLSLHPDKSPDADDVGITMSEIETACAEIAVSDTPLIEDTPTTAQSEDEAPTVILEPQNLTTPPTSTKSVAHLFHKGAAAFASGRVLVRKWNDTPVDMAGDCAPDGPLYPDADVLAQFASDLAAWDTDSADAISHPQLIVLRPSGGKAPGIALCRDGEATAAAIHETRKLGAVVSLWKSLTRKGG